VHERALAGQAVVDALNAVAAGASARFVPQSASPQGMAYERFIYETRQVPTRDNLHDFFNGLAWLRFPKTKAALNAMQFEEIERDGIQSTRGPVRDAVTVFDENGAVWLGDPEIWRALNERRWRDALVAQREVWGQGQLLLFGHALLEKLCTPRKPITAHVWCVPPCPLEELDARLAELAPAQIPSKPFAPLPVLGVPGWWPENAQESFYNDPHVFRPQRTN
jgi:hypothetical protein